MDGSAELAQLAHLLRVSAETAKNIAWMRPTDADRILPVARRIDDIANAVDNILRDVRSDSRPRILGRHVQSGRAW